MVNWRKVRLWFWLYVAFDLFFGGICGGFIDLTPAAAAQFTTVSGTVTDPSGLPYANGTITATLITSASPTLNGLPYAPPTQPVGLSSVGSFVMQLADNTQLSPGGTQWQFQACSAAGTVQPAGGKGPVCFTSAAITISGASQDISAQLQTAALPLSSNSAAPIFSTPVTGLSMSTSANVVISGPTTMVTPAVNGTYRFVMEIAQTTLGSGGTCTAGTVSMSLSYKNPDSGVTYALTTTGQGLWRSLPLSNTSNSAGAIAGGVNGINNDFMMVPIDFRAASGVAIQYQIVEVTANNCTTPPVLAARPALYRLGY